MRAIFTDRNLNRVMVLAVFLVLLVLFRHLAVLVVFFVVFERVLSSGAAFLQFRLRVPFRVGVLLQVVLGLAALAGLIVFGVLRVIPAVPALRADLEGQFRFLESWLQARGFEHFVSDQGRELLGRAQHYAGSLVAFMGAVGKGFIHVVIGLILAVVFLLERPELERWRETLRDDSAPRILIRYVSYVCDSIAITVKLQVIVALVNTLITLPVLIALRLPGIPALMAFLFVMALIPVVGGIASGVVMGAVAYTHRGFVGVGVFFISTFFLHKIESYYLSPKLTAQHVKLPGFVIITSLILFEHVFGIVGLFLSFPSLYVAAKIRESWRDPGLEASDEALITAAARASQPSPAPVHTPPSAPLAPPASQAPTAPR